MADPKRTMVTAVFRDRAKANMAYRWLEDRGYGPDDVNVLMSDETRRHYLNDEASRIPAESNAMEGVAAGGAVGAAVGSALAAAAAIGTNLMIPGLGLVVSGPLVAVLAGAGTGAVAGGLLGGLVGLGMSEPNAHAYEEILKRGGVALGVVPRSDDDATAIRNEFERLGGESIVTIDR
jgi:hypothetical protein